ncbi:CDP-alcohol phosphatidyltransferase family protein [candidate division KSB1 bacterium]|nr:CDP-alcohol phosphatidyltransferase family protein [candidate division KSB1 bacterium]
MANVSLKELRQFKHRVNPEERQGAYGYYFIRPLSLYVTYIALRLGLTANQVTVLQTLVGLAGATFLAFPSTAMAITGIFLLQFGFVLDNVDGEVARFRRQVSITGKFLDTIGHELVIPSMYFALGVSTYFRLGHFETIILGFLVGLFSLRLDIATMYHEAAQFIETKLDQAYSYYSALQFGEAPKLYRRKNEPSAIRMLYAAFAYPAVMNIITVLLLIDMFLPPFNLIGYRISLTYIFLVSYGILVPLRRVFTIWKLAKGREVERKYLSLLDLLKHQNKAVSTQAERQSVR